MADETLSLGLNVTEYQAGAKTAAAATDQLKSKAAALEAELRQLEDAFRNRGSVGVAQYRTEHARLSKELGDTERQVKATETQVVRAGSSSKIASQQIANVGGGAKTGAMGFLLLSQALEDSQYGFRAVANNIPGVAMAFGAGPGLAGAFSILATAINLNLNKIDDWKRTFKDLGLSIPTGELKQFGQEVSNLTSLVSGGLLEWNPFGNVGAQIAAAEAEAKGRAESGAKARAAFGGMSSDLGAQRGKALADVVRNSSLGVLGLNDVLANQAAGGRKLSDEDRQKLADATSSGLAAAFGGNQAAINDVVKRLPPDLRKKFEDAEKNAKSPTAASLAGALQDRYTGNALRGDYGSVQGVEKDLMSAGLVASPEDAKRLAKDVFKALSKGSADAISKFAADEGLSFGAAADEMLKRRGEKLARTAQGVFDEFDRIMEGLEKEAAERHRQLQDLAERERKATVDKERERVERITGTPESLAADAQNVDYATRMIQQLRTARRFGGGGMNREGAENAVFLEASQYARRSKFLGGLGYTPEQSAQFASEVVKNASPQAQVNLERTWAGVATTSDQLKQVMQRNVETMERAIRLGVPPYLR